MTGARERLLAAAIAVVLLANVVVVVGHEAPAPGPPPAQASPPAAAERDPLADQRWAAAATLTAGDLGADWQLDRSTGAAGPARLAPSGLKFDEGSPDCRAVDDAGTGGTGYTEHQLSSASARTIVVGTVAVYADEAGARAALGVVRGAAYRGCLRAAYERLAQGAVEALDRGPLELTVTAEERPVPGVDGDAVRIVLAASVVGPSVATRIDMDVVAIRRGRALGLLTCNLNPGRITAARLAGDLAERMGQGPPPA